MYIPEAPPWRTGVAGDEDGAAIDEEPLGYLSNPAANEADQVAARDLPDDAAGGQFGHPVGVFTDGLVVLGVGEDRPKAVGLEGEEGRVGGSAISRPAGYRLPPAPGWWPGRVPSP